jgi:hypothetical protein
LAQNPYGPHSKVTNLQKQAGCPLRSVIDR